MFFEEKKLTYGEIENKEQEFSNLIMDLAKSAAVWKQMRDFFASNSPEDYKYGYWRWFVELTWRNLNTLNREDFVEVIKNQIPMALLENYDVLFEMMWYLGMRTTDETDIQSLYIIIKKEFLESEVVVGEWQGKNVTVAELVKEIDSVYKTGDSLAQADFESKLRQILSPADEMSKKYFTADPEQAKERFLDLVSFFQTFTTENIWYVVDTFLNPEKYQNVPAGAAPPATPAKTLTPSKPPTPKPTPVARPSAPPAPIPKSAPTKPPAPPAPKPASPSQPTPKKEEPKLVVPSTIRPKPSPAQIKSQIESQFKKDADGNFTDIEGVMAKLSELAEKNNDTKIADMIYFDEKENKFKWNV